MNPNIHFVSDLLVVIYLLVVSSNLELSVMLIISFEANKTSFIKNGGLLWLSHVQFFFLTHLKSNVFIFFKMKMIIMRVGLKVPVQNITAKNILWWKMSQVWNITVTKMLFYTKSNLIQIADSTSQETMEQFITLITIDMNK